MNLSPLDHESIPSKGHDFTSLSTCCIVIPAVRDRKMTSIYYNQVRKVLNINIIEYEM